MPRLYWRNEAEVVAGGLLSEIPEVSEGEYDEDNMPEPSTLSPTTVEDFPSLHDLRYLRDLSGGVREGWERGAGASAGGVAWPSDLHVVGTKVGGWPAWTQPAD